MTRRKGAQLRASNNNDRAKAWTSMRVLMRFTRADLETTAGIKEENIKCYLIRLVAAGYLKVVRENVSGRAGSFRIYRLVRNTGPLAPIAWTNGQMYDQNTKQVFDKDGQESMVLKDGTWEVANG